MKVLKKKNYQKLCSLLLKAYHHSKNLSGLWLFFINKNQDKKSLLHFLLEEYKKWHLQNLQLERAEKTIFLMRTSEKSWQRKRKEVNFSHNFFKGIPLLRYFLKKLHQEIIHNNLVLWKIIRTHKKLIKIVIKNKVLIHQEVHLHYHHWRCDVVALFSYLAVILINSKINLWTTKVHLSRLILSLLISNFLSNNNHFLWNFLLKLKKYLINSWVSCKISRVEEVKTMYHLNNSQNVNPQITLQYTNP